MKKPKLKGLTSTISSFIFSHTLRFSFLFSVSLKHKQFDSVLFPSMYPFIASVIGDEHGSNYFWCKGEQLVLYNHEFNDVKRLPDGEDTYNSMVEKLTPSDRAILGLEGGIRDPMRAVSSTRHRRGIDHAGFEVSTEPLFAHTVSSMYALSPSL